MGRGRRWKCKNKNGMKRLCVGLNRRSERENFDSIFEKNDVVADVDY